MMIQGLFTMGSVAWLAGAGPLSPRLPVHPVHLPVHAIACPATDDLDLYPDEELQADLADELDDFLEHFDPDREYALKDLRRAILGELESNEGEAEGSPESCIDYQELVAEMTEAGTTLDAAVDEALAEADEIAFGDGSRSWTLAQAGLATDSPMFRFASAGPGLHAEVPNGRTRPRVAYNAAVRTLYGNIKR